MEFQGFPRIHSIFYAVFDIIKGTVVKHQVPEGSITLKAPQQKPTPNDQPLVARYSEASQGSQQVPSERRHSQHQKQYDSRPPQQHISSNKPLIDFEAISEYIIPKNQLYKRLVTISTGNYKVMGCPVVLHDHEKYRNLRNEFRFNLCFIFDDQAETTSYEAVVRKLSRVLEGLELECDFLSQDANTESKTVQNVIEQLYEDLNSYCECQIPINAFNTINLKLFPSYPNPPSVYDYQVPVTTMDVKNMMTSNWDITVQKVAKHINGINHVKKISELTNVKPEWTRLCMEHLMYYGCIVMTDIFQFGNVYAIQPELTRLLDEKSGLGRECLEYITLPGADIPLLSRVFALYSGLQYGLSVRDWMEEHQVNTLSIDIRRFISFGVIKGLIYRVHKYPILVNCHHQQESRSVFPTPEQQYTLINRNTGMVIHPDVLVYLDGQHHYDEICTQLKCSSQELDEHLGFSTKELPLFDSTTTVALETVNCQSATAPNNGAPTYVPQNNFPWKNKYPTPLSVPQIKPEWAKLVNNATMPQAPISVKGPDGSLVPPPPGSKDTYCHWSFYQCLKPTDIASCQKGNWAVTYDDGPSPFSTKLYDYLKQNNIKATFFVIGGQVIQYPDLLKRLHEDGHEIGIHTWSHQLLTSQTNEQIIAELKWTELAIQEVIGLSPKFMRPPFGDMDDRVREVVKQLGFIPVIWNHDTFDWKLASGGVTEQAIDTTVKGWAANASTATIGGISLEHDISQAGVEIALKALPVLKSAYNLTLTSQCGNISHQDTFKEQNAQPSTVAPGGKPSSDAMDSLVFMKTSMTLGAIAILVTLFL